MTKEPRCATCPMRAKYDAKPRSIVGRIWRFHINFCPGWKSYMKSLADAERIVIKTKYNLR
jgi:hypothetical protein